MFNHYIDFCPRSPFNQLIIVARRHCGDFLASHAARSVRVIIYQYSKYAN
jgi:hypothetical protein